MQFFAYFDEVPQVSALDELHHEEVHAAVGYDFVDADDIGMTQGAAEFSLADELAVLIGAVAEPGAQHF